MRIHDGAAGTLLAPHLRGGESADDLCLREPERVTRMHEAYLDAGAHAVQTNTFLAHARGKRRHRELVRAGWHCAQEAIQRHGGTARGWVTVGPVGADEAGWWESLEVALELEPAGVVCETIPDLVTARACTDAWRTVATGITTPLLVLCTVQGDDRWPLEVERPHEAACVGLNCCAGPAGLRPLLEALCDRNDRAWVAPSAGLPVIDRSGVPHWPLGPSAWAEQVAALVDGLPVAGVGGCCGTDPRHVGEIAGLL